MDNPSPTIKKLPPFRGYESFFTNNYQWIKVPDKDNLRKISQLFISRRFFFLVIPIAGNEAVMVFSAFIKLDIDIRDRLKSVVFESFNPQAS